MRPFVDLSQIENPDKNDEATEEQLSNFEISLLVMAKRVRLSFEELNEFTLNDFIKYVNMYTGEDSVGVTQNDIEDFYDL